MQHQARIAVFEKFEDAKDQLETPEIYTSYFAFVPPEVNKSVGISTPIDDPTVDCKVFLMFATVAAPAPIHYYSHPPQTPQHIYTSSGPPPPQQAIYHSGPPPPPNNIAYSYQQPYFHSFIHCRHYHNKCTTPMLLLLLLLLKHTIICCIRPAVNQHHQSTTTTSRLQLQHTPIHHSLANIRKIKLPQLLLHIEKFISVMTMEKQSESFLRH
jgi:hypothetical protein